MREAETDMGAGEIDKVRVETPARLHFGFLNLSTERDRLYGGIGVAVDCPRAVVEAERASGVETSGNEGISSLVQDTVETLGVDGARVYFKQGIPRHVGLGSGTQHALAVLHAVSSLYGVEPTKDDVRALGRGVRSGVGTGIFETGGFVVDSGHPSPKPREERSVPETVIHEEVPQNWRFVVVIPKTGSDGLHGDEEKRRMEQVIEKADASVADEVARAVVGSVLPGIAENDISAFGDGVERVESLNGRWYADSRTQGSEYAEPSSEAVEFLRGMEAVEGVGQSSWGPTVYGVTTDEESEDVALSVEENLPSSSVHVVAPDNEGARITRLP